MTLPYQQVSYIHNSHAGIAQYYEFVTIKGTVQLSESIATNTMK